MFKDLPGRESLILLVKFDMFLSIELYVFRCKALKLDHFLYIQVFQHVLFGRFVFSDKKYYIGKNRRLTFSFFFAERVNWQFFFVYEVDVEVAQLY